MVGVVDLFIFYVVLLRFVCLLFRSPIVCVFASRFWPLSPIIVDAFTFFFRPGDPLHRVVVRLRDVTFAAASLLCVCSARVIVSRLLLGRGVSVDRQPEFPAQQPLLLALTLCRSP